MAMAPTPAPAPARRTSEAAQQAGIAHAAAGEVLAEPLRVPQPRVAAVAAGAAGPFAPRALGGSARRAPHPHPHRAGATGPGVRRAVTSPPLAAPRPRPVMAAGPAEGPGSRRSPGEASARPQSPPHPAGRQGSFWGPPARVRRGDPALGDSRGLPGTLHRHCR